MTRVKKFSPKRKFRGNQHSVLPDDQTTENSSRNTPKSSSERKLSKSTCASSSGSGNIIISVDLLTDLVMKFVKCKFCDSEKSVIICESVNARKGLATKLQIQCNNCQASASTMSSKLNRHRLYEINTRLVLGMRCIGKGKKPTETFCAIMNLPPPPVKFSSQIKRLAQSVGEIASESMRNAAREVVEISGSSDIVGAFDGSWQRRGHTSLNGVMSATSLDTGKVLDVEVMSKYCKYCEKHLGQDHKCTQNYKGYSGGMEVEGAVRIFQRSQHKLNVRFVKYLGDGDSKAFRKLQELKPYGDNIGIEKLECVGHVQKRMGTRLRNLVKSYKGKKVGARMGVGGAGRLSAAEIDRLQQYYGLAIRRNVGDLAAMRRAVWAIYFHKSSTDEEPSHNLCPKGQDSWCKYQKNITGGEPYQHKHSLPREVMEIIKPVFRDLSDQELLKKCMHGRTQNPNECFNSIIWERLPKNVFVQLETLKLGVMDAINTFNDGSISRTKVLEYMGIEPGQNMVRGLKAIDQLRVAEANEAAEMMTKEARSKKRLQKRKRDDKEQDKQQDYGPGMF